MQFTGLGGTDEVGASSYLYTLPEGRLLIDAGVRPGCSAYLLTGSHSQSPAQAQRLGPVSSELCGEQNHLDGHPARAAADRSSGTPGLADPQGTIFSSRAGQRAVGRLEGAEARRIRVQSRSRAETDVRKPIHIRRVGLAYPSLDASGFQNTQARGVSRAACSRRWVRSTPHKSVFAALNM